MTQTQEYGFDLARAAEHYRLALLRVVAALFEMAGLAEDEAPATLPRHLRNRLLRLLRPAESAARRLIVIAARGIEVTLRQSSGRKRRSKSSVNLGLDPETSEASSSLARTHSVESATPSEMKKKANSSKAGVLLRFHGVGPRVKLEDDALRSASRPIKTGMVYPPGYRPEGETPKSAPANLPLPLLDPLKRFDFAPRRRYATTIPRVRSLSDTSLPVHMRRPEPPAPHTPAPDDALDATRLGRRLTALKRALDDIDGHARRLARWKARRDAGLLRAERSSPMRPGWPPGRRKRPVHEVDGILRECHALARDTWNNPDTS